MSCKENLGEIHFMSYLFFPLLEMAGLCGDTILTMVCIKYLCALSQIGYTNTAMTDTFDIFLRRLASQVHTGLLIALWCPVSNAGAISVLSRAGREGHVQER